jgi:tRNA U34 5-methylaminomethyl-2-thiouridine-forming methyltransferase MnmC
MVTTADGFLKDFHIAELGFGTALNLLVAWDAWTTAGFKTPLRFTSFEAFPMTAVIMARAHAVFSRF